MDSIQLRMAHIHTSYCVSRAGLFGERVARTLAALVEALSSCVKRPCHRVRRGGQSIFLSSHFGLVTHRLRRVKNPVGLDVRGHPWSRSEALARWRGAGVVRRCVVLLANESAGVHFRSSLGMSPAAATASDAIHQSTTISCEGICLTPQGRRRGLHEIRLHPARRGGRPSRPSLRDGGEPAFDTSYEVSNGPMSSRGWSDCARAVRARAAGQKKLAPSRCVGVRASSAPSWGAIPAALAGEGRERRRRRRVAPLW